MFFFLLSVIASEVASTPTYELQKLLKGETNSLKCQPCGAGQFCRQTQELETSQCKPDCCFRHSECGPGYGVKTRGSSQQDTVCEKCSKGFHSSSYSVLDKCVKHKKCASGELVLFSNSTKNDTMCGTCQDFSNGGETLRNFFSVFFISQEEEMPMRDLKRFIRKIILKYKDEYTWDQEKRGPLLDHIRSWLAKASVDQLKELPKALRISGLCTTADRLKETLTEIMQQDPTCSLEFLTGWDKKRCIPPQSRSRGAARAMKCGGMHCARFGRARSTVS